VGVARIQQQGDFFTARPDPQREVGLLAQAIDCLPVFSFGGDFLRPMEPILLCAFFNVALGTNGGLARDVSGWEWGFNAVLDREYFVRQIRTLLTFAKSTSDPAFAAFLLDKAASLKSQAEAAPPAADVSPRPPDVEPEK
jgi:hypothetical protein